MPAVYDMLKMTPPQEFTPQVHVFNAARAPSRSHRLASNPRLAAIPPTAVQRFWEKRTHNRKGRRRRARDLSALIDEATPKD